MPDGNRPMTDTTPSPQSRAASTRYRKATWRSEFMKGSAANIMILSGLILLGTVFGWLRDPVAFPFYSTGNLAVLSQQIPVIAIMAIGAGLLMIAGEFDLSVAGVYTICPYVMASAYTEAGWPLLAAVAICFLVAALIGLTIGLVTTRLRVPSFIASLGMMFFLRGVVRWFSVDETTGQPGAIQPNTPEWMNWLMSGQVVGPLHMQTVWLVGVGLGAWLLLNRHVVGNHILATGGDPDAAEKNGIDTRRTKLVAFALCSCLAALAGLMQAVRINVIDPGQTLTGLELQAIAAAVIGGTYLFGGRGSVSGMILGAVLLVAVENILLLVRAPGEYMPVFIGTIVIVSVIMNTNFGSGQGRRSS